jgi:hypothetical protein
VISKGLAKARLQDALRAFNSCTDLGLDVQLKILQALPSLLQNYATELEGDFLSSALQVCSALQAVKAATVSGVASATLQQLVSTVFEKVASEDRHASRVATIAEVPGDAGPLQLRPAAYDAYRLLRDLALAAEERATKFVTFTSLSPESSLELIWSCIDANVELFAHHDELIAIIGANVFPIVLRALSERLAFAITVRSLRILNLLLDGFLQQLPGECEVALGLCAQALDIDTAPEWKRAMVMEILRDFFDDSSHVVDAWLSFDTRKGGKSVIQDLLSTFVRLSAEKPSAIGLGSQSTAPVGATSTREPSGDQSATIEAAGGVVGVISSALGVTETSVSGISTLWSLPRTSFLEQLDKVEAATVPETYVYVLVLECLNGLSDCLARIILPLTVHHERLRSKQAGNGTGFNQTSETQLSRIERTNSLRSQAVPLNPLAASDAPYTERVKAVASLVESCWPAVLAASSTFLNAALDDHHFRNLIKAYQRFAQVAGLLRLATPRDALMTTLAKASVPPHVLNAVTSEPVKTPNSETSRIFSNPMSLLSVDSLVSQSSLSSDRDRDRDRRNLAESPRPMLMVRNLLCLRALLNLAIALGPTLDSAFGIVVDALRHTDLILSSSAPIQSNRQGGSKAADAPTTVQAFSNEVAAVEAAASRLLESTADYPNDAFMNVLQTFCQLLRIQNNNLSTPPSPNLSSPTASPGRARKFSTTSTLSVSLESRTQDHQFVIPKLGNLAKLNVSRFVDEDPNASGWIAIVDELVSIARTNNSPRDARRAAANVLAKLAEETIAAVSREVATDRAEVQQRALIVLTRLIDEIFLEDGELTSTDLDIQNMVLESLRAILERSGESLIAGWDRMIAIIAGGAFERQDGLLEATDGHDSGVPVDWQSLSIELVSPQIGRTAFATTELLCSDFLDSLPIGVMPSLINLLQRFMCQIDDLNTALTTITMSWNVSDFLFSATTKDDLAAFIEQAKDFDDLEDEMRPLLNQSRPAQWLFLLICLRNVTARPRREVRNAAFQTVCNAFKTYGQELQPSAWDMLLRCTILNIARTDSYTYYHQDNSDQTSGNNKPNKSSSPLDIEMSKVIITGNADVIAEHLPIIGQVTKLPSLWEGFLSMLERYLDIENHTLNAAVYSALAKVLTSGVDSSAAVWKGPVFRTVHMWLKRVPTHEIATDVADEKRTRGGGNNQEAYLAYILAGSEVYALTCDSLSFSQTRILIDNLYTCIAESDGPLHRADVGAMSPVQANTIALLRKIKSDQNEEIPGCLVTVAAKLACLHHETTASGSAHAKPTFVAVASEGISWLQEIVRAILSDNERTPDFESILEAIQSLRRLITTKYAFPLAHKAVPLWHRATSVAAALAIPIHKALEKHDVDQSTKEILLKEYTTILDGIINAHDVHTVTDQEKVCKDEEFDIESLRSIQSIMVSRLRDTEISADIRSAYVKSLFTGSLIHRRDDDGEILKINDKEVLPLGEMLGRKRRGRTEIVSASSREEMAYVCLEQLIALASGSEDGRSTPGTGEGRDLLASAVAPHLILRLALPIQAYVADQPLRGKRPQPLSELEELLICLEAIGKLHLLPGVLGNGRDGLSVETTHVTLLYPLLIKAMSTASDPWSGAAEVRVPLQNLLASL